MKITVELDEPEIKRAIDEHLDGQGYTVEEIKLEKRAETFHAVVEAKKKSDQ
jgi:TusA-related sulfurtransferase